MRHYHTLPCLALLVLAAPVSADPPQTPPAGGTAQAVLDKRIGKHEVLGFTERGDKRFLGRVISGDHGLYVVQTFHYVTAPATTLQTTTTTVRVGRRWKPSRVTTKVTTQSVVADDVAVRALLSGVAGAGYRPHEEAGPREMVAPGDVLCLQELLPPAKAKSPALLTSSANALPPNRPAASTSAGWTMKTLWASPDLKASTPTKTAAK